MTSPFLGATVVWLHDLPHWGETGGQDLKRACFRTAPAIRRPGANWLSEIIGTFVLILIVSALLSKAVGSAGSRPTGLAPYLVGMVIWGIGLSLGGTTGYAINPALDLGPRLAHAVLPIAGKGGSDWGYALIPVAGAVAAALAVRVLGI
jgi:glycerol uptake facilitator protein